MKGIIEGKDQRTGQKGPYTRVKIGGNWYGLFGPNKGFAEVAQVGMPVEYTTVQSGKYTNLETIAADGNAPAGAATTAAQGGGSGSGPNIGMRVSYAKDLLAAGKAPTAADAVALVTELVALTTASVEAEEAQQA